MIFAQVVHIPIKILLLSDCCVKSQQPWNDLHAQDKTWFQPFLSSNSTFADTPLAVEAFWQFLVSRVRSVETVRSR